MGWFDAAVRSEAEIEAEIGEELEFHLEQRTRELVEQGMSAEEARAEAERRFGSVERVRQSCRWVQLGERIMLQRIQFVLNLVLVSAVVVLGWSFWQSNASVQDQLHKLSALLEPRAAALASEAGPTPPRRPDPLVERFKALADPQAAAVMAGEVAALEPVEGIAQIQLGWPLVQDPQLRKALLQPFVANGGHVNAIDVLHLAATDRDPDVRAEAFRRLKSYAWQDFAAKPASLYLEWHERWNGMKLTDVLADGVARYRTRLSMLHGEELRHELAFLDEVDLAPGKIRDYDQLNDLWWVSEGNVRGLAARWIDSDDTELQLAALRFFGRLSRDPEFASDNVRPLLGEQPWRSTDIVREACEAWAASGRIELDPWSETTLRLLDLCVSDGSPEVCTSVGSRFLARLWRLPAEPVRSAAQWQAWWAENRTRFPAALLKGELAQRLDAK